MNELSIFIDESGDFGEYDHKCPYYVVALIVHEQKYLIDEQIKQLNFHFEILNSKEKAVHSGPLIRREGPYKNIDITDRRKIFNTFFNFTRKINIKHKSIVIDKKHKKFKDINNALSKELSMFVNENFNYFQKFDKIIIYYDNGQNQLANILISVFSSWFLNKFEYRVVSPYEYKLFQASDLICTLALIEHKLSQGQNLTKSESLFFNSKRDLKMKYLKHLKKTKF